MEDILYVGHPFSSVEKNLKERRIPFSVERTYSTNNRFCTDDTMLYVIREQYSSNGLLLTVAAKMGKEVS